MGVLMQLERSFDTMLRRIFRRGHATRGVTETANRPNIGTPDTPQQVRNKLAETSQELLRRPSEQTIALGVISIAYVASRLANLLVLPVMEDEAGYLRLAQLTRSTGDVLLPLHSPVAASNLSPLFIWATSIFLPYSSDPVVVGRLLSVVFSTLGLIGVYKIGTRLYSDTVGLAAAVMYTIIPFQLFFDRQALLDPLMCACGVWSLFYTILLVQGSSAKKTWMGLGLTMVLAPLAKWPGAIFVVLPLFVMILCGRSTGRKLELMKAYMTCFVLYIPILLVSGGEALGVRALLYVFTHQPSHALVADIPTFFLRNLNYSGVAGIEALASYLTVPIALLALFALALGILRGNSSDRILLLWFFVPSISITSLAWFGTVSEHLLFALAPLLILTSRYLVLASRVLSRVNIELSWSVHRFRIGKLLAVLFLLLLLVPSMAFDKAVLADPTSAPLPMYDRRLYISGHSSGYGNIDAIRYLKNRAMHGRITLLIGWESYWFPLYLCNNPNVTIIQWFLNDSVQESFPHIGETYAVFDGVPAADGTYGVLVQQIRTAFLQTNPTAELVAVFHKPESFGLVSGAVFVYYLNVA